MKQVLLLIGVLAALLGAAGGAWAQNTPFSSPALDSNCYFPQIGNPNEMDTILGAPGQDIGGGILKNLGTTGNGGYGKLMIGSLTTAGDYSSYNLWQIATGPGFNLHLLQPAIQTLRGTSQNEVLDGHHFGHFRDRQHLDLFVETLWRIYWADDAGNYDSTRFTQLASNVKGDRYGDSKLVQPYCTYLTSDTVSDIVIEMFTDWKDVSKDSGYVLLFRGASILHQKDTAFEDTSCRLFIYPLSNYDFPVLEADFRGVGREDLVVPDINGNLCYYRNDPPFMLSQFADAVAHDTLYALWQDTAADGSWRVAPHQPQLFAMPALPKSLGDRSVDFLPVLHTYTDTTVGIFLFRGGSDFGSHRLTSNSADFVITPLIDYSFGSGDNWPQQVADAGDMTGTGNHILFTTARNDEGDYWWDVSYVTGKALDNKINIWNSAPYSEWPGDTLTANADSLQDFLFGRSWPTAPEGDPDAGSLWLYYGSKRIPVRLNPQWSDVKSVAATDGASLSFSPNPVTHAWSVATIVWPDAEEAAYSIYDMLGRKVQEGPIRLLGGAEQQRMYFSGLSEGTYIYLLTGAHHTASTKFVKLSAASGATGTSSPSFMQTLQDARDGGGKEMDPPLPELR